MTNMKKLIGQHLKPTISIMKVLNMNELFVLFLESKNRRIPSSASFVDSMTKSSIQGLKKKKKLRLLETNYEFGA